MGTRETECRSAFRSPQTPSRIAWENVVPLPDLGAVTTKLTFHAVKECHLIAIRAWLMAANVEQPPLQDTVTVAVLPLKDVSQVPFLTTFPVPATTFRPWLLTVR